MDFSPLPGSARCPIFFHFPDTDGASRRNNLLAIHEATGDKRSLLHVLSPCDIQSAATYPKIPATGNIQNLNDSHAKERFSNRIWQLLITGIVL